VEGLLQSQFVRRMLGDQTAKLRSQGPQPLRQLDTATTEVQHPHGHQPDVARSHGCGAHDVARPQRQGHAGIARPGPCERDLETAKAHDLRARIDAQNPYHRHEAECKVIAVKIAMLLLAAGRGSRFGGPIPKAYLKLAGRTLLATSANRLVQAVATTATIELIVLVHPDDRATHLAACMSDLRTLVAHSAALRIVDGGATRQESMLRGLAACSRDVDFVLVHDAARALVPIPATRACLLAAQRHGAALLAVPAPDTLKRVSGDRIETTVDRTGIWQAQTPQIVRRELLQRAFDNALATGFQGTDDVSLVEHLGEPVVVVPGAPTNVKITRPEDLPLAEAILAAELA
jgi:2-C-methyl-D-erythritol 4-phosphate cytidylyltransferase